MPPKHKAPPLGLHHLVSQIQYNQEVADEVASGSADHRHALAKLQQWQRARLDATYQDLRATERYSPACEFFLDELYGGRDVARRDAELNKAAPVMKRFLPDDLLGAVGDALRLQAMSLAFDFELAGHLLEASIIDQPTYAEAYRAQGQWTGRREQLKLISDLGRLLGQTVQHAMVHRLIRMMRTPAKLAGVGLLQSFLQEGLDAFAHMGPADHFIDTIQEREGFALEALLRGESHPFSPWIGTGPDPVRVATPVESSA